MQNQNTTHLINMKENTMFMRRMPVLFTGALLAMTTIKAQQKVKLITLDPGHFHAALVQKSMYPQVDRTLTSILIRSKDIILLLHHPPAGKKWCTKAMITLIRC
jgi:hypothetical protein